MSIDITIYKLREGIQSLPDALTSSHEWHQIPSKLNGGAAESDMQGFVHQAPSHDANWVGWLKPYFEFDGSSPQVQSAGFALSYRVHGSLFALTFGTAWQSLARDAIEPDFGLIAALNQLKPNELHHLVTKTVDLRTRERSTYKHSGGRLDDFDLDMDVEWLRSAIRTY